MLYDNQSLDQMNVDNSGKGKVECSVIQWSADPKNPNQQWKITALPNGNYVLTNVGTGYNLGFPDAGLVGEPVFQLEPEASKSNQQWQIRKSNLKVVAEALKTTSHNDWRMNVSMQSIKKKQGYIYSVRQFGRDEGGSRLYPSLGAYPLFPLSAVEWKLEV